MRSMSIQGGGGGLMRSASSASQLQAPAAAAMAAYYTAGATAGGGLMRSASSASQLQAPATAASIAATRRKAAADTGGGFVGAAAAAAPLRDPPPAAAAAMTMPGTTSAAPRPDHPPPPPRPLRSPFARSRSGLSSSCGRSAHSSEQSTTAGVLAVGPAGAGERQRGRSSMGGDPGRCLPMPPAVPAPHKASPAAIELSTIYCIILCYFGSNYQCVHTWILCVYIHTCKG